MRHAPLGQSGLRVPVLGLGTNSFGTRTDRDTAAAILDRALDAGCNLIDTANTYARGESEAIIGQAIRGRRQEFLLATKAGLKVGDGPNDRGASRWHLMREIQSSLRRLQTDYVDIFWVHTYDPDLPREETLRALDDLVRLGVARYVGCSNHRAWELALSLGDSRRNGLVRYTAVQPSYSLADRTPERELIPLCLDQGLGVVAYYPLAGGILSGKYRRGEPAPEGSRVQTQPGFARFLDEARLRLAEGVAELARQLGCTPAQLSLAWLIRQPAVASAIAGATRVQQLEENLGALQVQLSDEVMARLEEISRPFVDAPPFAEYRLR